MASSSDNQSTLHPHRPACIILPLLKVLLVLSGHKDCPGVFRKRIARGFPNSIQGQSEGILLFCRASRRTTASGPFPTSDWDGESSGVRPEAIISSSHIPCPRARGVAWYPRSFGSFRLRFKSGRAHFHPLLPIVNEGPEGDKLSLPGTGELSVNLDFPPSL